MTEINVPRSELHREPYLDFPAHCRLIPSPEVSLRVPSNEDRFKPEFVVDILETGAVAVKVVFGREADLQDDLPRVDELMVEFENVIDSHHFSSAMVRIPAKYLFGEQRHIIKHLLAEVCTISLEWDPGCRTLFLVLLSDVFKGIRLEATVSSQEGWEKFFQINSGATLGR